MECAVKRGARRRIHTKHTCTRTCTMYMYKDRYIPHLQCIAVCVPHVCTCVWRIRTTSAFRTVGLTFQAAKIWCGVDTISGEGGNGGCCWLEFMAMSWRGQYNTTCARMCALCVFMGEKRYENGNERSQQHAVPTWNKVITGDYEQK